MTSMSRKKGGHILCGLTLIMIVITTPFTEGDDVALLLLLLLLLLLEYPYTTFKKI
jgi:hypothetical protein